MEGRDANEAKITEEERLQQGYTGIKIKGSL